MRLASGVGDVETFDRESALDVRLCITIGKDRTVEAYHQILLLQSRYNLDGANPVFVNSSRHHVNTSPGWQQQHDLGRWPWEGDPHGSAVCRTENQGPRLEYTLPYVNIQLTALQPRGSREY